MIERLKKDFDNIEVPESLSPEAIEEKLFTLEKEKKLKKRKKSKIYKIGGLAAACIGVIALGLGISQPSGNTALTLSDEKELAAAKDYEEIYSYIEATREMNQDDGVPALFRMFGYDEEVVVEEAAVADTMSTGASMGRGMETGADYSTTNVRQDGVDEADIVKTDGRYLYVLKDDNQGVAIVDTQDNMQEVQEIRVEGESWIQEFYLLPKEQKLVIINCTYMLGAEDGPYAQPRGLWDTNLTEAITYDVSDAKNPIETGKVMQSGAYISSRASEGYIYLFTQFSAGNETIPDEPVTYVPAVNEKVLEPEDIYMPMCPKANMYTIVTSVDVNHPEEAKDSKAIFAENGNIYVSNENIYYYDTIWASNMENEEITTIRKISYKKGEMQAVAQGKVSGYLNDSFSIDEHEGYLRLVMTVGNTNSVYVLDEKLEVTGSIEGLAEDERVYSARFIGETGYFVTFRETDPLFTVDFSDTENPQIIGKLKIPGFSEYLHFYGEDKLLGIGMEVNEETGVSAGAKLSMFDIRDRANVKQEAVYLMEDVYSTDVSYDYKAALIDVEKNIIGFAGYPEGRQCYYLFSYDDEEGFICKMEEDLNGNASRSARGIYIGEILYVVQGNVIESYSLYDYKKIEDIIL